MQKAFRIAVVSIPKSGTYLMARLLKKLGFSDSELHLGRSHLTDYRNMSLQQKRGPSFRDRVLQLPLEVSANMVTEGQFALGHLPHNAEVARCLEGFRKIVLIRNLYDAVFSRLRWRIDSGRESEHTEWVRISPGPEQATAYLHAMGRERIMDGFVQMAGWLGEPDVLIVRFETLTGNQGAPAQAACLHSIGEFLNVHTTLNTLEIFAQHVWNRPAPTLSLQPTRAQIYLNKEVEKLLSDWGLGKLNETFGYGSCSCGAG